ncbi:COMM domain-containing protein 5 isoform X1 [Mesoplodon densirostris]|uniref:COMM domain-containing protein 5 isoform X1 n=2 Tax=Mesoplodon densirostris TaxID=48708 RepID=UPI0028DB14B3|nr:COMM domain-containing protein 5 isoform X1 [Mesoplodon densirostris]XP_059972412.1 COMM domain-containing protein 5 isoform X1 [Mesoplodon densirostris]
MLVVISGSHHQHLGGGDHISPHSLAQRTWESLGFSSTPLPGSCGWDLLPGLPVKEQEAAMSAMGPAAPHLHRPGDSHSGCMSFLGAQLPPEVAAMPQLLRDLDGGTFRKLLKLVVSSLQGEDCREAVRCLGAGADLPEERLGALIAGTHTLLQQALRLPPASLKPDAFKNQLQELCIPQDLVVDLASVVFGSQRPLLDSAARQQGAWLPHVADFRWRVDVAISTSTLARSLQPSVLMQLKLSDGSALRFEVPTAKFQELRFAVAMVLKEMADLEKRCERKLQD